MSLNPPLRASWMKRGKQLCIPAHAGTRQYLHWAGGYDYASDSVYCQLMASKTGDQFIEFLETLIWQIHPDDFLILVMDNASYHHTASVHAFLNLVEDHVMAIFLPAYCPELNLIEPFWLHLKDQATANTLFPCLDDLKTSVDSILAIQNDLSHPKRFTLSKHFQ